LNALCISLAKISASFYSTICIGRPSSAANEGHADIVAGDGADDPVREGREGIVAAVVVGTEDFYVIKISVNN